ncbi:MAG: hypothetical protein ACYDEJ_02740 [Desulfitobacteriaceae bacterium]
MEKNQDQGKEIWLHPEELKRMILGSLHWTDVEARLGRQPEKAPKGVSFGGQKLVVQSSEVRNRIKFNKSSNRFLKKLEGLIVVILLVGVALLTMVTWTYFVFYR